MVVLVGCCHTILISLLQVTYDPKVQARTVTLGGDLFDPQGTATGGE